MILLFQLVILAVLPFIVYLMLLDKFMKKGLFKAYLSLTKTVDDVTESNDERDEVPGLLLMGLLVGTFTMIFMVPIALIVSVPVFLY